MHENKQKEKKQVVSPWPWMCPFTLCPPLSVAQVSVLSLFRSAAATAEILLSDRASSKNKVR